MKRKILEGRINKGKGSFVVVLLEEFKNENNGNDKNNENDKK
jgi:hypothetical protein